MTNIKKNNNVINIVWITALSIILTVVMFFVIGFTLWFFLFIIILFMITFIIKKFIILEYFILSKGVFGIIAALLLVIFIIISIVGFSHRQSSGSNNLDNSNADSISVCKASDLKERINPDSSIKIVDKDDVFKEVEKQSYSISELPNLMYGYSIKETGDGFYAVSELCKGDKSISKDKLNGGTFHIADKDIGPSTAGNYMNFTNIEDLNALQSGQYTVYLYTSINGESWKIAQKFDFNIN